MGASEIKTVIAIVFLLMFFTIMLGGIGLENCRTKEKLYEDLQSDYTSGMKKCEEQTPPDAYSLAARKLYSPNITSEDIMEEKRQYCYDIVNQANTWGSVVNSMKYFGSLITIAFAPCSNIPVIFSIIIFGPLGLGLIYMLLRLVRGGG